MRFASSADFEVCRKIHKAFGTTYYFATQRFPKDIRQFVHATYGFVRVPDEWVDNPGNMSKKEQLSLLANWRSQLLDGLGGKCPEHAVMRAFVDTVNECGIDVEEALAFLDAMEMDVTTGRYETYSDLQKYMNGSASAVGVMMLSIMERTLDPHQIKAARKLGEAMQMTNFLRDIGEDLSRSRVYIPVEDLKQFGLSDQDLRDGVVDERFIELMKFEISRTRDLYAAADEGIAKLGKYSRPAVQLARVLYSQILDVIEDNNYDVFSKRARTSKGQKLKALILTLSGFNLGKGKETNNSTSMRLQCAEREGSSDFVCAQTRDYLEL